MINKNSTRRVLIVEDEPSAKRLMEKTLEKSGYEVVVAMDGRDAMKTLGTQTFDVILMDLMMPERDGFELCRLIRINPTHQNVAIIMMSGLTGLPNIQRALTCGANDYITKPWVPEEVVIRIAAAIRMADLEKDNAKLIRLVEEQNAFRSAIEQKVDTLEEELGRLRKGIGAAAESLSFTSPSLNKDRWQGEANVDLSS